MYEKLVAWHESINLWLFYGLLAYMPLHVLLSTWLGTSFHALTLAKALKDIVLVFLFARVLLRAIQEPWFRQWLQNRLVIVIGVYGVFTLFLALIRPTGETAEITGLVFNTRFLLFFLTAWLIARLYNPEVVRRTAVKVTVVIGAFVVLFGIAQYMVIPNDALSHMGYVRSNGVLPAFFIDDKPDLERVMSSLKDPNSLGSYLLIILPIAAALFMRAKRRNQKILWGAYGAVTFLCMWFTFSRSAWIGAIVTLGVFFGLFGEKLVQKLSGKQQQMLIASICAVVLVVVGTTFALRNTYFVQNVVLHADSSTTLEDPNELRIRFWKESLVSVGENPLGRGPGTAGLASIKNTAQPGQLTENYYLQIAIETGFVGFALFMIILVMTAWRLFRERSNNIAKALLASFAGLAITNFLVHIWSVEAVACVWWGLAGLYMVRLTAKKPKTKPSRA